MQFIDNRLKIENIYKLIKYNLQKSITRFYQM